MTAKLEELSDEQKENFAKVQAAFESERKARRTVYEAIISLMGFVDEETLLEKLPVLDSSSWNEVVEERFLSKVCGWPLCAHSVTERKLQKYHIDRRSRKVYEVCSDRAKFCSTQCFDLSSALRSQLETEALWITGKRKPRQYSLDLKITNPSADIKPLVPKSVEIVEDKILAQLSTLCIAEGNDSTDSESEERGSDEDTDDETKNARKKEDSQFLMSIKRFVSTKPQTSEVKCEATTSQDKMPPKGDCSTSSPGVKQKTALIEHGKQDNINTVNQVTDEAAKLERLRGRYGTERTRNKKAPLVIDAPSMPASALEEKTVRGSRHRSKSPGTKMFRKPPSADVLQSIRAPVREWIGDRTRDLIRTGGARPVSEMDRILRQFYAGDYAEREEAVDSVRLPNVHSVDVHKMRSEILLTSLRKPWTQMERRLAVSQRRSEELGVVVRSLDLSAENVAGFNPAQLNALVLVLFRMVCMLCPTEEDAFFPSEGPPSIAVSEHLRDLSIDFNEYSNFVQEIESLCCYSSSNNV